MTTRLLPISKSPWGLMDPTRNFGNWDNWTDVNSYFRSMDNQMRDMEKMICNFDHFTQLAPATGHNTALSTMDDAVKTEPDGSKKLNLQFDVRHFKPDELQVKTHDNVLTVNAIHEEQSDTGKFHREYHRQYVLPDGIKLEQMKSVLSPEGVLSVEAPMNTMSLPTIEQMNGIENKM